MYESTIHPTITGNRRVEKDCEIREVMTAARSDPGIDFLRNSESRLSRPDYYSKMYATTSAA